MAVVSPSKLPVFKKASDLAGATGLNMILFGPPGIGKTTLAASAQDSEYGSDVLLFNLDGGVQSIADRDDVAVWPDPDETPNPKWIDFRQIVDQLISLGSNSPYRTLVFDSISSIYNELIIPKVVGSYEKQPAQNQWGDCNRLMLKLMMDVNTLNSHGINTLWVGHVKEERDDDVVLLRLGGTPQAREEMLRIANVVGYYDWDRRKQHRVLKFKPEGRTSGPKFQQPLTGPQMPLELSDPTMSVILEHYRKRVNA